MTNDNISKPLTLNSLISALPLVLALVGGVTAYNNLQLQITELRVGMERDSQYIREALNDIRTDAKELKQKQETNVQRIERNIKETKE